MSDYLYSKWYKSEEYQQQKIFIIFYRILELFIGISFNRDLEITA